MLVKAPPVVHHGLQHNGMKAPLTVVGAVHTRQACDGEVCVTEGPKALEEAKRSEAHNHLQGVGDLDYGVGQHVLEGATDLKDDPSSGHLAHLEQVANVTGGHGQLHEGNGHSGLCEERLVHGGGLAFQVWAKLLH